jgi:flavin-dependent dehydrogenase
MGERRLYDLVVVGGSFAGLIAARSAALLGLRVALLERKQDVGERVRSTGILVKEAAEELDFPRRLARTVRGVRLYGPNLRAVDLYSPGYYFLATDTPNLLRWLTRQASEAGVEIIAGRPFAGFRRAGELLALGDIAARYLLGADGPRSAVAREAGLGLNRDFLVGSEIEFEGDLGGGAANNGLLHCLLDSKIAPGYIGWVVPGVHGIQVGLAVSRGKRPDLGPLLARLEPVFGFDGRRVLGRRGGPIPCGGLVRPLATDKVMLIGDAAGMVSPLTAGGIHNALRFGRRAAQAIADHLLAGGPEPSAALARELPGYAAKAALRRLLDTAPPNRLLDQALRTAPMRAFARHIYFHKRIAASEDSVWFRPASELPAPLR